ncbi:Uncharacterized protein HZ326_0701 [Fusarium oxysporum f. sp. albedinis]|nr:Uncharacterized protein HZ326_0701 [Fusarium oxysporum f. sp. albedinis]
MDVDVSSVLGVCVSRSPCPCSLERLIYRLCPSPNSAGSSLRNLYHHFHDTPSGNFSLTLSQTIPSQAVGKYTVFSSLYFSCCCMPCRFGLSLCRP